MLKIIIWLRRLATAVGLAWLAITLTPLVSWWAHGLAQPWGNCQGDVLIVLGGNALGDGILGTSSYWRSVYTVRVMRAHPFQRVIFSGGKMGNAEQSTAELMRHFVLAYGMDPTKLEIDADSSSTRENALRAAAMMTAGHGKVVLLTSDYHVWRSVRVFRRTGLEAEPCPVPDALKRYGSWELRGSLFVELVNETAKIAWYRWKGWI